MERSRKQPLKSIISALQSIGDLPEDFYEFLEYELAKREDIEAYQFRATQKPVSASITDPIYFPIISLYKPALAKRFFHITDLIWSVYQATPVESTINFYSSDPDGARDDLILGPFIDIQNGAHFNHAFNIALSATNPGDLFKVGSDQIATVAGIAIGWEDENQFPIVFPVRRRK